MSTRENGFEFLFFYKLSTLSLQFARKNDLKSLVFTISPEICFFRYIHQRKLLPPYFHVSFRCICT